MRGLNMLLDAGIRVRLKAMAMRSNATSYRQLPPSGRAHTKDYFRFDPQLHLRFDGDTGRNEMIRSERLSPEEIVALESGDAQRFQAMQNGCDSFIFPATEDHVCNHLFHCGAGKSSFSVSSDGYYGSAHPCGTEKRCMTCARATCTTRGITIHHASWR